MTSTRLSFSLSTEVSQSYKANQVCSMFDAPVAEKCERSFDIEFPWDDQPWNVGLVVGPSGSGKSSVMKQVWGDPQTLTWSGAGIVDDFDGSVEDISAALSSVGFSTVPAWLRPHRVLSVGEQFRADVARRLMSSTNPIVIDEYTSVVDRQVAKVASHATQRFVRQNKRQFVAVGCHYDVIDWLQPDWVLDMATQTFTRRLLQRRPDIRITIGRLPRAAWGLFSPFHYMTADLPPATHGFGLWAEGRLACSAWIAVFPHAKVRDIVRVARVVTLPDYQGLGLAFRLTETLGSALKAGGRRFRNYPAHPGYVEAHKKKSDTWKMIHDQEFGAKSSNPDKKQGDRYVGVFEYVGPANARFAGVLGLRRSLNDEPDRALVEEPDTPIASVEAEKPPPAAMVKGPIREIEAPMITDLMSWVPICGDWRRPEHMRDLVRILSSALTNIVRALIGVSVRHGKTTTVVCACSWWLRQNPKLRIIYMTYSIHRAQEIGKDIRDVCRRTGVKPAKEHDTIASWRTEEGGGVSVMSAQQSKLGADVDILIVDDPYESAEECDKPDVREAVDSTITHYTSRLNRGGSCILVMSRWREDDAIGVRLGRKAEKWEYVHKRAIEIVNGQEIALCEEVRTVEEMHAVRAALAEVDPTERLWFAQWQNEPFTPDAGWFKDPARYSTQPVWPGWHDAIGVDMAYSTKHGADYFALVAVRRWGPQLFVRAVRRFKADEGVAEAEIRAAWTQYGQCPVFSYMSGPEVGIARNMAAKGIPVQVLPARYNKMIRARKTMDRWNAGNVLVKEHGQNEPGFVKRVRAWRGLDGDADDEIDALVSAHDGMMGSGVTTPAATMGKPRM